MTFKNTPGWWANMMFNHFSSWLTQSCPSDPTSSLVQSCRHTVQLCVGVYLTQLSAVSFPLHRPGIFAGLQTLSKSNQRHKFHHHTANLPLKNKIIRKIQPRGKMGLWHYSLNDIHLCPKASKDATDLENIFEKGNLVYFVGHLLNCIGFSSQCCCLWLLQRYPDSVRECRRDLKRAHLKSYWMLSCMLRPFLVHVNN